MVLYRPIDTNMYTIMKYLLYTWVYYYFYIYDLQHAKRNIRTFALNVVSDQPAQSAQANPRRHFTKTLDFALK